MTTQRRMLDAVTQVAGQEGYGVLTVERVREVAQVSRATFYQYFSSLEDCFRDAYRQHADTLVCEVADAIGRGEGDRAVLTALVDKTVREPNVARLLMMEALAAGPVGLGERDALIARLEQAMIDAQAGGSATVRHIPPALLIGAVFRFLSIGLTRGTVTSAMRAETWEWVQAFSSKGTQPCLSDRFTPVLGLDKSRPRTAKSDRFDGSPHERILRATAAVVSDKGYRPTTVADIVTRANVSRRLFYDKFTGKLDAFIAAYEHIFGQVLAVCTPAYFRSQSWPQRVWDSSLAFTRFLTREPCFAYLGFVECYAGGRSFAERVHDTQLAFTLFLEEGYRQREETPPSRGCAELTTAAIVELGFQASRLGVGLHIRRLQPLAVYIALTPFIGLAATAELVADNLSSEGPIDATLGCT